MSYAAKGEKVFAYQDPKYPNCTPRWVKRSDHRLKSFRSTMDSRAWHFCEEVRYDHLHDLMSGSRTCLGVDHCHRYVPLEDLLRILMAGNIAPFKKELQQSQGETAGTAKILGQAGTTSGTAKILVQAGETAEKEKLQAQIAGLTGEVNKSRDMLRQAMHKLENIDEIVNENKKLQCRLRCSEERVKFLEAKKKKLETELADLRTRSQIQMDLEKTQQMLTKVTQQREESTEMDEVVLQGLAAERNGLQEKIRDLERELMEAKKKEAEIEALKKQSQSDSLNKEEICRENECYRKKLASMKCLEKQIQELKKQGRALADKYRRESRRAAEQLNKMSQAAKELKSIREERDSLRKRVDELSTYESQFNKLKQKLQRVDAVIEENENLNLKLCELQKLEKENEYLKCRLETIRDAETTAVEDRERIMQLQCAVADQEEEMKDLLCQIERLTSGKHEEELERLRCELYEKKHKLKLCEEQLAEIPMLEAEIDELRRKLQCCCRDFPDRKREKSSFQKLEVRYPTTSSGIRANYKIPARKSTSVIAIRREEKVELQDKFSSCQEFERTKEKTSTSRCSDKKEMSCEEVQKLLESSKGIISCVLEDMIEHQKEMEELEICNKIMKEEIKTLKAKIGNSNVECLQQEISILKKTLEEKNAEISGLRQGAGGSQDAEEIETLRDLNTQLKAELQAACDGLKQMVGSKQGAGKVVPEDSDFDCCGNLQKEIEDLKCQIQALNTLTEELKKENELLRELQKPCPDFSKEVDEKCALENLLSLLQAELETFKGQKLSDECEALRNELKRVLELNCQLKTLVDCYRERLDLEKQSTGLLQQQDPVLRSSATAESDLEAGSPGRSKSDKNKELRGQDQAGISTGRTGSQGQVGISAGRTGGQDQVGISAGRTGGQDQAGISAGRTGSQGQVGISAGRTGGQDQAGISAGRTGGQDQAGISAGRTGSQGQAGISAGRTGGQDQAGISAGRTGGQDQAGISAGQTGGNASLENKLNAGKEAQGTLEEKMNACEEELKALKKSLAQAQQENEELKNSLKESEKKVAEKATDQKPGGGGAEGVALQDRLKQLEAENAEKLKRLMEQHEKEQADREKKCNENLNAMKAGYETDIRKLTERHKQSVMRLQALHEDELREINHNYEKQLETMQTQSEQAINDVAKGSAAKLRKLTEQHAREMSELEGDLTESKLELLRTKENADARHARDMQKARAASKQKLNALRGSLDEDKKKAEAEAEELRKKLKEMEEKGVCDCKTAKKKEKPRDPTCPLDFNEVLEKILEEGLDSLTFNEIALVHRKACCALEGIMMNSRVCPSLEPPIGDSCPHTPLLEADKQQLLARIFALENEIIRKQRLTQDTIISMEIAIKKERCRLQELKTSLQNEQQKNSELKMLLSSQTMIESDLKKERDQLTTQASLHQSLCEQKSRQLDEEINKKKCLELEVEKLKAKLKQLCATAHCDQIPDACKQANQLEVMRLKLEQAFNQERRLALQLENEAKYRMQLQCQLQAMRQQFKQMVNLPDLEERNGKKASQNLLEAKSVKERQNLDQIKEGRNKIKSKVVKKHRK